MKMAQYAMHHHRKCVIIGQAFINGTECAMIRYMGDDEWVYAPIDEVIVENVPDVSRDPDEPFSMDEYFSE